MQYIAIKQEEKNGKNIYLVNAIPLKNKNQSIIQKIPHPLGSDILTYETIDEAKEAITRAGFSYILPSGEKGNKITTKKNTNKISSYDYSQIILDTIQNKIDSSHPTVSAAAILALSEFPTEETFDILFNKLGEDNDQIRKNAISGICRYGNLIQDRIIETLKSPNWVARNSAITCIQNLVDSTNINVEKFIIPLTEITNDTNTIVQTNAILTLAKVYQSYQKNNKI